MFNCCKTREKRFKFENGTEVRATSYEGALLELKRLVRTGDQETSWNAYLDLKDSNAKIINDEIFPLFKNSFVEKFK